MLGAQEMMDYDKYLGLPMVGRKSKVSTFKELQEKITNRVIGVEGEEYIEGWARGLKKKCHSSHTNLYQSHNTEHKTREGTKQNTGMKV